MPCLSQSVEYWRAVGYFTSHGLALAAKGLAAFLHHGGRMKLVASPLLEPEDIEAFERGYESRQHILERSIELQFDEQALKALPDITRNRLECIAWLIGEGRLDIKLAVPPSGILKNSQAIYHEKMGVFFDRDGNTVVFSGSSNETVGGLVGNFESLDVYVSWNDPHGRVERKTDNFRRLWHNHTPRLTVLDFPDAAKHHLLRCRPTAPPIADPETGERAVIAVSKTIPDIPAGIELRPYQIEACEAWLRNNGRGMLSMATGTGKTVTSLATAIRMFQGTTTTIFGDRMPVSAFSRSMGQGIGALRP